MEQIIDVGVLFIGLIFLIGMVESVVRFVEVKILHLSEEAEEVIGYILSIILGYFIAMYSDYRFLAFFGIEFYYGWMNWLASGALIGAGTGFVVKHFDILSTFLNAVSGLRGITFRTKDNNNNNSKG